MDLQGEPQATPAVASAATTITQWPTGLIQDMSQGQIQALQVPGVSLESDSLAGGGRT